MMVYWFTWFTVRIFYAKKFTKGQHSVKKSWKPFQTKKL